MNLGAPIIPKRVKYIGWIVFEQLTLRRSRLSYKEINNEKSYLLRLYFRTMSQTRRNKQRTFTESRSPNQQSNGSCVCTGTLREIVFAFRHFALVPEYVCDVHEYRVLTLSSNATLLNYGHTKYDRAKNDRMKSTNIEQSHRNEETQAQKQTTIQPNVKINCLWKLHAPLFNQNRNTKYTWTNENLAYTHCWDYICIKKNTNKHNHNQQLTVIIHLTAQFYSTKYNIRWS